MTEDNYGSETPGHVAHGMGEDIACSLDAFDDVCVTSYKYNQQCFNYRSCILIYIIICDSSLLHAIVLVWQFFLLRHAWPGRGVQRVNLFK